MYLLKPLYQALVGIQFWTIRPNTYVSYLLQIKSIVKYESNPMANRQYGIFFYSKIALYCLVFTFIAQALTGASLLMREQPIAEHLSFDPLMTIAIQNFPSLNYFTLIGFSLLALFPLYLDYAFSFLFDYPIVKLTHQLALSNYEALYLLPDTTAHLEVPPIRFLHPWDTFTKWRSLFTKVWHPTYKTGLIFSEDLKDYPNLSFTTRARLWLISAFMDILVACSILAFGK